MQADRDVERVADLTPERIWARPGGAASVGFHLRHVAGVLDRLLTNARAEELSEEQLRALRSEGQPGEPPAVAAGFVFDARAAVEKALDQVRVRPFSLLEARKVGRKRQAGSVVGLLSHTAEHATRHIGQATTSAKVQRGGAAGQ